MALTNTRRVSFRDESGVVVTKGGRSVSRRERRDLIRRMRETQRKRRAAREAARAAKTAEELETAKIEELDAQASYLGSLVAALKGEALTCADLIGTAAGADGADQKRRRDKFLADAFDAYVMTVLQRAPRSSKPPS